MRVFRERNSIPPSIKFSPTPRDFNTMHLFIYFERKMIIILIHGKIYKRTWTTSKTKK